MTHRSLAAALRDQSDRLTNLAMHLASQGQESISTSLAYHAAELAAHETTARRLEAEARAADAAATGLRAALKQARATNQHLEAELREEASLPAQDNSEAAIARRQRFGQIIARILPGTPPPGCTRAGDPA